MALMVIAGCGTLQHARRVRWPGPSEKLDAWTWH